MPDGWLSSVHIMGELMMMKASRKLWVAALLGLSVSMPGAARSAETIAITEVWLRPALVAGGAGAAFAIVKNAGNAADKIVAAKTSAAGTVELHTHTSKGGVMQMRRVDAIDVPANGTVELAPGGFHVMLMDMKKPLKDGDSVPLTLVFEKSGEKTVNAAVRGMGQRSAGQRRMPRGSAHQ
jgi:copper(I)-binding protein